MLSLLRKFFLMIFLFMVILGGVYPFVVTLVAQVLLHSQSKESLIGRINETKNQSSIIFLIKKNQQV